MTGASAGHESPSGVPPGTTAQRRYLTVLFADLSDSTALSGAMEAELYCELLEAVREAWRDVIPRYGGTVVRAQGDGVLAIFGFPTAREDDGCRATEAALELHERVRAVRFDVPHGLPPHLSLHTGIHSGLVLLDQGDLVRGRFELLGDAPNLAARLSDAAERNEILVSEETLGPSAYLFESTRLQLSVKGRARPLTVRRVLARASAAMRLQARAQRGLSPLVGRERELQTLMDVLDEAMRGVTKRVVVAAAPGLGKTRLVSEFLRCASERLCDVHTGYCESYLSAEPLQPFLQMLRAVFGTDHDTRGAGAANVIDRALGEIDPELLAYRAEYVRLLSLGEQGAGGEDTRRPSAERITAALCAFFASRSANRPAVLFIDDLQWADDATRQVLEGLRRLTGRPLLVVVATRGVEAGDVTWKDAETIELAPLSDAEAADAVSRLLPRRDPFLAAEIARYSGGNPLFIEELCHTAEHEDVRARIGPLQGNRAWLSVLIESRVARLPARQAELVRAAAVIGNVVPAWLLRELTGAAEDDPLLLGLADQDLLFPAEQPAALRFKHGIARDVIYEAVGLRRRREMHLRIASLLQGQNVGTSGKEGYEALAYHYKAGGDARAAAHYAELAGDKAIAASALDRAQAQYRAALAALDVLERSSENYARWIAIVQRFGLACVFDPARDQLEVLRRGVALAREQGDEAAQARTEYWLGYVGYALGESRDALWHCEQALLAARSVNDVPLIVQIQATLGQALAAACDYDRALALLDAAIEEKRQHRSQKRPSVGLAYSLACKASVLGHRARFADAHLCFDEAIDAVRGSGHEVEGSVVCWRSAVYAWQGRWAEAHECALIAQGIAERVRTLYVFGMSRALAGYAGWMLDRQSAALQALADATSWLETHDKRLFISLNYGWLADAMVETGDHAAARLYGARALARARKRDRLGEAMACRALARCALSGGARRSPLSYLTRATRVAKELRAPQELALTQMCEAEVAAAGGDRLRGCSLLHEAAGTLQALEMFWHQREAQRRVAALQPAH